MLYQLSTTELDPACPYPTRWGKVWPAQYRTAHNGDLVRIPNPTWALPGNPVCMRRLSSGGRIYVLPSAKDDGRVVVFNGQMSPFMADLPPELMEKVNAAWIEAAQKYKGE